MDDLTFINNTSVYRNPAPQSPLQGPNVLQPAAVYSQIMLQTIELAESDYIFDKLATERTMPSNNGSNEIVFKRMLSLAAHTQPLVEGIPPASDQGRMVAIKASTAQYGRVMKFTDKVDWAVIDPLISEYTRQLSLKVPEMKDILAQEALLSECQTYYACRKEALSADPDIYRPVSDGGAVNHIMYLTPECTPTIDEFRKIVLSMEAAKVRPLRGANFLCVVSPAVMFDLITDRRMKEFMKYAGTGEAYKNDVVVDLFSLVFQKSKTIKTDNTFIDADGTVQYIYHVTAQTGGTNASDARGYNVIAAVPYVDWTDATAIQVINLKEASIDSAKDTWSKVKSAFQDHIDILNVHHSFVLGEDCLFRIGVQGHTTPQFIKKELGSAGTEDPLNQRQSIGWKLDSLGYKVPNPDAVVDYMSVPSQYRVNMHARPDLKNEFTDYWYGYVDNRGAYYHPEQVVESVAWDPAANEGNGANVVKYFVRGTTDEVHAVKMTKLVKPVNGRGLQSDGKVAKTTGTVPTTVYYLASNPEVRFLEGQVSKHTDGKYYIKGLAGTASAEVKFGSEAYDKSWPSADGSRMETRKTVSEDKQVNATGDARIDDAKSE